MKIHTLCVVAVVAAAVVLYVELLSYRNLNLADGDPYPAIDVEREIRLGEHELQTTVEPSVIIRNRGRQPLSIEGITASCGCANVFVRDEAGGRAKITGLEIPPKGEVALGASLAVSGPPGIPQIVRIRFQTNDPRNPEVEIRLTLTSVARYLAMPAALILGTIAFGEQVEQDIDIVAFDRSLPAINRVTLSDDRIHVKYQATKASSDADRSPAKTEPMGWLRVVVDPGGVPGEIEGTISVFRTGREEPVVVIPVKGRAVPLVELAPQELLLPRVSGSGPLYTASCLCRAPHPRPLALAIDGLPAGLTIRIKDVPDNPSAKLVEVDATALQQVAPAAGVVRQVPLLAEVDGRRVPLSMTVSLKPR